jgi:hypothetical protein
VTGRVHKFFFFFNFHFILRVMAVSLTSANEACINELWTKNGEGKVLKRVTKYCLRPFETHEANPV